MQSNADIKFNLMKILINTTQYQTSITETQEAQNAFINTLQINQYTHHEIIELIHSTQDKLVKSLLITHLLSMEEYLNNLMGNSILNRLTNNESHTPSRLNPLIHQLDITHLTIEQIKRLQPEAAISILCSIPHFHLLNEDQINELLGQYPNPGVIQYWMNHYALMPNAYYILAHLSKLVDSHVLTEIHKMDHQKKETLINCMLEHLDLYNPRFKLLHENEQEKHLKTAINHYLNGKNHDHYVSYIKLLAKKLLSKPVPLSVETIQLLMHLNGSTEFSDITNKTGYLTNYYLRLKAQSGDTQLFYKEGTLIIHNMTQLIQLRPPLPQKEEEKGGIIRWIHPAEQQEPQSMDEHNTIPENPLIQLLAKKEKSTKAFDYFLLHFKGKTETICKTIRNYLGYYVQEGCSESRRKTIYHTAILMIRPEVNKSVREAIYTSFLQYPELYDENISYWMFKYDAQRTLQHFGLKGGVPNYILVMEICTDALKKLDPKKDEQLIQIATKAYSEAKQELSFSEDKGFFALLIQRIKRCWINGWTGFFSPNLPMYVAPSWSKPMDTDEERVVLEQENRTIIKTPDYKLPSLLKNLEKQCSLQKLDELIEDMSKNPFNTDAHEELNLRARINLLFHELLLDSQHNKGIESWLSKNHQVLNANRYRLLELMLIMGSPQDLELLIKQINEDSSYSQLIHNSSNLESIVDEFSVILPELKAETELSKRNSSISTSEPITLDKVSSLVTDAWNWTKGNVGSFFAPNSNSVPSDNTPSNTLATQSLSL
ncbi:type IV secretion protein Dot [Legionella bononiensis]|uniref:Type IV secretion protein Dot n=1 Tax=Legionella bononiensis TaxID=2793102 RepID=A0ABS1W9D5_9GAMM|nr:type IV secretion protein Dot [Legionella bononiensis]MBL7480846.1 type IV secretion protein Dot [Legionella bononiensis]MBL7525972.1 type IV secretion protein Dot [Legionella bononiensis]MBL7563961.1 type IV secretion protein Dot [Legionella bononiensis]